MFGSMNSGTSSSIVESCDQQCSLEKLITLFKGRLKTIPILQVYCDDFEASMECMLGGPILAHIITLLNNSFEQQSSVKIKVDADDVWQDIVVNYKSPAVDLRKKLQVRVHNQPAIDTGGVCRQVYDTVFNEYVSNKHIKPSHSCRPTCTVESRSCDLFNSLGLLIVLPRTVWDFHICHQHATGIWWVVKKKHISLCDVGADTAAVVSQVHTGNNYIHFH